ncbi:MAG: hypothetical protein CW338_00475 [Clostridiales bacterium]|nr:hypothetical protein [Clostridiales bacterium]
MPGGRARIPDAAVRRGGERDGKDILFLYRFFFFIVLFFFLFFLFFFLYAYACSRMFPHGFASFRICPHHPACVRISRPYRGISSRRRPSGRIAAASSLRALYEMGGKRPDIRERAPLRDKFRPVG